MKRTGSSGLRRSLRRLTDPALIGWPFFVLSLAAWLVSFYPQVFRGRQPFTGDLAIGWVLSILVGQVVLFAFLLLARTLWLRTTRASRHPAIVVWTFVAATLLGVIAADAVARRLPAGDQGLMFGVEHVVFGVLGLCIVGSILTAFRAYRADVTELMTRQLELRTLVAAGQRTLDVERASVHAEVAEIMTEAVGALARDDPRAVDVLRSASDTLLRPLSHELASDGSGLTPVEVDSPRPQWRTVVADVTAKPLIAPLLTAMILLLFAWRISFDEVVAPPPQAALDAAGNTIGVSVDLGSFSRSILELFSVFLGTYLASWLVLKATTTSLQRARPRTRLLITAASAVAVAVLAQVIIGALFTVLDLRTMIDRDVLARSLILVPIAGVTLLMGAIRATELAQRDVREQLGLVNRALTWQVARLNEEIWDQRRTLALVVHGPVRAALLSSAMELANAEDPRDPGFVDVLTDRLSRARSDFLEPTAPVDPLAPLAQLRELWAGTCALAFAFEPGTRERLTADRITTQVAVTVIEEACANAIAHGRASTIDVDLSADADVLDITVTNDGTPAEPTEAKGLGTAFLEDVSLEWRLESREDGSRLSVRLPLGLSAGER